MCTPQDELKFELPAEPDLDVLYDEDNTPWKYDPEVGDWISEFDSVSWGNLLEVYGPMYGEKHEAFVESSETDYYE